MKFRVYAAPLPDFGSDMPVLWNNYETTEMNSANTVCGFDWFFFVILFSVGFFVCLFFNMSVHLHNSFSLIRA